jgi:hypothetical protein
MLGLSVLEARDTTPSVKDFGVSAAQPQQVDALEFLADDEHAVLGHREANDTRALILWRDACRRRQSSTLVKTWLRPTGGTSERG